MSFWLSLSECYHFSSSSSHLALSFLILHSFFISGFLFLLLLFRFFRLAFGVSQTWAGVPVDYLLWDLGPSTCFLYTSVSL